MLALKHYYKKIQSEMEQSDNVFKLHIIYSDRGRSDAWCAPSMAYACESANEFDITINPIQLHLVKVNGYVIKLVVGKVDLYTCS